MFLLLTINNGLRILSRHKLVSFGKVSGNDRRLNRWIDFLNQDLSSLI